MKTTFSLGLRWACSTLMIGSLSLIGVVVLGEAIGGEVAKRDVKDAAKMVDAIVNRNKPLEIVKRRSVRPREFPLFPKKYDWKEEERVRTAFGKLSADKSIAVWEALVENADDRRYCGATYSGSSGDVYILSVGDICSDLAYGRLCEVFQRHLPSYPPHGCPIQFWDIHKNIRAWRTKRKDKALYQLQMELCEMALRELPKLDDDQVSDKEKAEAAKKIELDIALLRRTKRPIFNKKSGGYFPNYLHREAERVREAYEKGTLETFESGLNR